MAPDVVAASYVRENGRTTLASRETRRAFLRTRSPQLCAWAVAGRAFVELARKLGMLMAACDECRRREHLRPARAQARLLALLLHLLARSPVLKRGGRLDYLAARSRLARAGFRRTPSWRICSAVFFFAGSGEVSQSTG